MCVCSWCHFLPSTQSVILSVAFGLWVLWHIIKNSSRLPVLVRTLSPVTIYCTVVCRFENKKNKNWRYKNKSDESLKGGYWAKGQSSYVMKSRSPVGILRPAGNTGIAVQDLFSNALEQINCWQLCCVAVIQLAKRKRSMSFWNSSVMQ